MKNYFSAAFTAAAFLILTACSSNAEPGANADNASYSSASEPNQVITRDMIQAAQEGWIQELVRIGEAHATGGDAAQVATDVLNAHYDYATNPVLFKPTLAFGERTFRPTHEGAHAYFVGGNSSFPEDDGFALRPYVSGITDISEVFIHGDVAIAQGNITLTAYDGSTVMVDKTFGYRLDDEGHLRIVLHHSSLPFAP